MLNHRSLICLSICAVALSVVGREAAADNEKGTAVIKGKVLLDGELKQQQASVKNDAFCQSKHPRGKLPVEGSICYKKQGNAVPYAFVYVKEGIDGKYDVPTEPIVLDQKNCQYSPHVVGMIAGQTLNVKNSDDTNHNIHAVPGRNSEFNISQPNKGVRSREGRDGFPKPEMNIKIKCDIHPWMNARCHVMKHPFFDVTKDHVQCPRGKEAGRGTFEIGELPAGKYVIAALHETLGEISQTVTVAAGETKEIVFTFKAPADSAAAPAAPSRTIVLRGGGERDAAPCRLTDTSDAAPPSNAAK